MKIRSSRPILLLLLFLSAGCGGSDDPAGPDGGGGDGDNTFTATIDGLAWASDTNLIGVSGSASPTRPGTLTLSGYQSSSGRAITLSLSFFIGPATQPLGVNVGTTPGGVGTVLVATDSWLTPLSGAAGFVTLSARTDERIAGTFHFTADALAGAVPATRSVTAGAFDITIDAGLPPLPAGVGSTAVANVGGAPWYAATIIGLNPGAGVFSLGADNTAYSISITPKIPVAAGNTYGIPSQMNLTVIRTGTADSWAAITGPDIGTVSITMFTADRLVASFEAELPPLNATAPLLVTGGAINAYLQ
ncbi:MAG: hypothetical protein IPM94_11275 [bacterium]|nr:hypothetical protein [bacterium]